MASLEIASPHLIPGDRFDAEHCHPEITLGNDNRSASVKDDAEDSTQCVIGSNTYLVGEHEIRIRLDDLTGFGTAWIGMTSIPDPELDQLYTHGGLSAWCVKIPMQILPDGGTLANESCGNPWITGDVIALHLDCENHTLRAQHLRSGATHTIHNVIGPQRLFIAMRLPGTAISLVHSSIAD